MPKLSYQEVIDVSKIYSISGLLKKGELVTTRPFRSPHHTSSKVSIVGGGSFPKPGEVTLAHRGILFMDEFNEFDSKTLEALRQPIEDKVVNISRVAGAMCYPANFMLIAALNPCKCGYLDDDSTDCICSSFEIEKYKRKISGPIIDRIDLQLNIKRVNNDKLINLNLAESSSDIRARVEKARGVQLSRYQSLGYKDVYSNSDLTNTLISKNTKLSKGSKELLRSSMDALKLSARSYFRVLKVARTIADLSNDMEIQEQHIAETLSYRLELGN